MEPLACHKDGSAIAPAKLAAYPTMMGIPVQWKANGKRHLLPFRRWYPTANCKGKIIIYISQLFTSGISTAPTSVCESPQMIAEEGKERKRSVNVRQFPSIPYF